MFSVIKRVALVGAATTLSFSTATFAATLAGGPIGGNSTQASANCYVLNTGASSVGFSSYYVLGQFGSTPALTYNTCGSSIAPYSSCGLAANIQNNQAYSCVFNTTSSTAALRGSVAIVGSNNAGILQSNPLR